ncbi:MAG: CoA ester lyase [Paracoccaceae bacterium]|jgi:(3S)-malyl-CoA thioesterase|nr:CoA ester lyase [Paracoccaceae bacterium]
MIETIKPYRSVLYMPGANTRALDKARSLKADAIIFDLEDAVAVSEKISARENVAQALKEAGYGKRSLIVRINGLGTDWWEDDLKMVADSNCDAILVPKVDSKNDIRKVIEHLDSIGSVAAFNTRIWAMIETPDGILNASEISRASSRVEGFVMGTNDLQKELNTRFVSNRGPLITSLSLCVLAAKSAGIICVDGVYNAFKDEVGLLTEAEQGRDLGFDGKTVIHPLQLEIVNKTFAPSLEEKELYISQIKAFEEAITQGKGVAVLDGKIVENLHVEIAKRNLGLMTAIEELE